MAIKHETPAPLREVEIPAENVKLAGILNVPAQARGLVLFAHGTGSNRWSSRNQFVAEAFQSAGLGSLRFDLLQEDEANDLAKSSDIRLLADRLLAAAEWLRSQPETGMLPLGYFGASTGAAVALTAAAVNPREVGAVVSRGGRPDLAHEYLPKVEAPTLLIVGGNDLPVVRVNEESMRLLKCRTELALISGATHLFPEPGALEEVARRASRWFEEYLA